MLVAALAGAHSRGNSGARRHSDSRARRRNNPGVPGHAAWIAGCGFFAGAFTLTLWMRALSLLQLRFSVAAVAIPLALVTAVLAAIAWPRWQAAVRSGQRQLLVPAPGSLAPSHHAALPSSCHAASPPALRFLWFAIAGWMTLRFISLLLEVIWIPLYPWDAWVQWATKARVWYGLGHIVPFVHSDAWFAANGTAWFDAAPNYPATVPLWQVWSNLALGRWDDSLMNLPWWLIAVALALAVYGLLRTSGVSALGAIIGAWLVSSLPLANVHVALAGYADLPMGAYFALAALALWRWTLTRHVGDAALALLLAIACVTIKTPGLVWALALAPAVVIALAPRTGLRIVGAGVFATLFALLVLARMHPVVLGYRLHLDFAPATEGLLDSFFLLGNWNLLWYAVIAVAIVAWRELGSPRLLPLSVTIGVGFLFLAVVFGFTNARNWVADQTTINRAVLHIAPLVTVWMVLVVSGWFERRCAPPETAPAAASGIPVSDSPTAAT
jgi:hypothetical protein